ncbi:MAG: ribulose-phosphate 3-epimerase [Ignavibacterium sp.]|nr:ribulose-phosphate 3-epimerase [Ignavibacterium sp.]MDW8374333.1 ribulose-phosphate 3-epimerase [Ignavibacteriales bacterium]
MKLLAPSILSADFLNLSQQIKIIEDAGADLIHCDVMDGQFVPNITFGPFIISSIKKVSKLPLDVHLMIKNPENFIDVFAESGADYISVHYEEVIHLNRLINKIKDLNKKAGVVLNPSTPVSLLVNIIEYVDFVLLMSVNPGFGGQKFIDSSLRKIKELVNLREKFGLNFQIEIDGGISQENLKDVLEAGADIIVAGASIFNSNDISSTVSQFKKIISSYK